MNAKILNRDFQHPADGWYQIEPKGDHPNRAAKVVQVIDDEAISAIVNRFNTDAAAGSLRHGQEMLIDHEHFSGDTDKESRAYGWLQELQNRADGIYGRIRWTATGKAAVDGGDYRFFSTEYDPADLQEVKSAIGNRQSAILKVRPLRLDGLSLTNMNNNRGQKPITNRDEKDFPGSRESGASPNQNKERTNTMKSIAEKLGLAPEASEAAILGEVTKLQNRVTALAEHETENTTLKNRITQFDGEQVDSLLELHGVKEEKVKNRLKPVLTAMKNREDRVAALLDFGFKQVEAAKPGAQVRIINRADGKPVAETPAAGNESEQVEKILNRAREIQNSTKCSFDSAHSQAARELIK